MARLTSAESAAIITRSLQQYNAPALVSQLERFLARCWHDFQVLVPFIEDIALLQDRLRAIDRENIAKDAASLGSSIFAQTPPGIFILMRQILAVIGERPRKFDLYRDLLESLSSPLFRATLVNWVARLFTIPNFHRQWPQSFFLINQLQLLGMLNPATVGQLIKEIAIKFFNYVAARNASLVYFGPEGGGDAQSPEFEMAVRQELAGFDRTWLADVSLCKNDWAGWRARRATPDFGDRLLACLMRDDLDGLQSASAHPDFNIDATITPCSFVPFSILHARPPLISAAAFFGAVHCCTWLALRANVVQMDLCGRSPLQFAIAGGCDAVVTLFERRAGCLTPHGLLQTAAAFSQMGIYGWILQNHTDELDLKSELVDVCKHAIHANSIRMIQLCFDQDVDVNYQDASSDSFPLWDAVESGSVEAALMLLAHPQINVCLERNRQSAADLAAQENQMEILRYFPADVINDIFERCWDFAMTHAACASLRVLYDVSAEHFMDRLNQLVREAVDLRHLDSITEDVIDLFWSLLEPRDRETLFVLALTTAKLMIVYALLTKAVSFTEPVRGRDGAPDLPLFWAIEGGQESVHLFIGLAAQRTEYIIPSVPNRFGKTIMQIAQEQPALRPELEELLSDF
jgi:hypothetical protein